MVHDGSYMPKVAPNICSAAVTIVCQKTHNTATCSITDFYPEADNYRAEALGALIGLLLIQAATIRDLPYKAARAYCDNKGIVIHATNCTFPLKVKQSQSYVISLIKQYIRDLPILVEYTHVFGHPDDILRWDQLTHVEQLNVLMDSLAKRAPLASIGNRIFIDEDLPFEPFIIRCGQQKVRSSRVDAIYCWWGYRTARALFHNRMVNRLDHTLFDLVYWQGMDKVMNKKFSRRFRTWMAKHVSGCCGVNSFLSKWDKSGTDRCPSCNTRGETTAHVTICLDPARVEGDDYDKSIESMEQWLESNDTDPILAVMIQDYLEARGESSMVSLIHPSWPSKYSLLA